MNESRMENVFIGISGMIGAGKTTLATALAKELNLPVHYEPVTDNVYLADFYKDMSKYAFPLQIYLLNKRFKQQQQIVWNGRGGVQDRTIYEDTVFAKMLWKSGHMSERDYETYLSLFSNMSHFMKKPNIIVHLDVSPEQSMDRIKMRSRGCESGMSLDYLKALHQAYEDFIADISRVIPVIKVDYSKFPTAEQMAKAIKVQYAEIANIRHVAFNNEEK
ncbi:deoxynucleoside kinase [bacterium]|nr:deoxynucleoside kinase [bacterium]